MELSKTQKVICDLHLTAEDAETIANLNQVVFLVRQNNDNLIDEYCSRKSHEGFNNFINSSSNPMKAKQNCNEALRRINDERYEAIKNSKFLYIERTANSTVENTLKRVEEHFRLTN